MAWWIPLLQGLGAGGGGALLSQMFSGMGQNRGLQAQQDLLNMATRYMNQMPGRADMRYQHMLASPMAMQGFRNASLAGSQLQTDLARSLGQSGNQFSGFGKMAQPLGRFAASGMAGRVRGNLYELANQQVQQEMLAALGLIGREQLPPNIGGALMGGAADFLGPLLQGWLAKQWDIPLSQQGRATSPRMRHP